MAATVQEKFDAAVKVIRGLPKNGSFQPSHELMLKFYAYYKQATEGPCNSAKPGMWQLVSRKKWEAWSELGQMDREEAMLLYVEELKNVSKHIRDTLYPPEIVETMPQTEQVAEFVQTLGAFYELIEEGKGKSCVTVPEKRPNGSAVFNGQGDGRFDHSVMIGEMLKINNNDTEKDSIDDLDEDKCEQNGMTQNGQKGSTDEEDEEEEQPEERGFADSTRLDSGSDTDEFCDTSDQMIQMASKLPDHQAGQCQINASTLVDSRRETKVRFASNVGTAFSSWGNGLDYNTAPPEVSDLSSELMAERLALGSAIRLSFLPQGSELPPRHLTDSLHVNNSFSSLASIAGNDSIAGYDVVDEDTALDDEGLTFADNSDSIACRGGGDDDETTQAGQGSGPEERGSAAGSQQTARGSSQQNAGAPRRGQFSQSSGSGGQRHRGDDQRWNGSLDEQILLTLIRLQQDMTDISNRLASLELTVKLQIEEQAKKTAYQSKFWPFPGMSRKLIFLLVVWPFLAPFIMHVLCQHRRSKPR